MITECKHFEAGCRFKVGFADNNYLSTGGFERVSYYKTEEEAQKKKIQFTTGPEAKYIFAEISPLSRGDCDTCDQNYSCEYWQKLQGIENKEGQSFDAMEQKIACG